MDGFWVDRLLLADGIESHVVDAASIAVERRHRRAKTNSIDGEMLLQTLMAWACGERRVCSQLRQPPLAQDHDRARLVLAAPPAGVDVEPLVSVAGSAWARDGSAASPSRRWRANSPSLMALCHPRRHSRVRGVQGGLTRWLDPPPTLRALRRAAAQRNGYRASGRRKRMSLTGSIPCVGRIPPAEPTNRRSRKRKLEQKRASPPLRQVQN